MNLEKKTIENYFCVFFGKKIIHINEFQSFHLSILNSNNFIGLYFNDFNIVLQYEKNINDNIYDFYLPYIRGHNALNIIFNTLKFENINKFFNKISPLLFKYNVFEKIEIPNLKTWDIYKLENDSDNEYNCNLNYKTLTYNQKFLKFDKKNTSIRLKLIFKVYRNKVSPHIFITVPFINSKPISFSIPLDVEIEDYQLDNYLEHFESSVKKNISSKIAKFSNLTVNQIVGLKEEEFLQQIKIASIVGY